MCFSFFINSFTSKCQAHTSYGGKIKGSTYPKKDLNFVFRDSTTIIWPKTAKTRVMSWRFLFSCCFFEVHFHVSDGMPPDANNRIRNHIQIESGTSRISTRKHTRTNSKNLLHMSFALVDMARGHFRNGDLRGWHSAFGKALAATTPPPVPAVSCLDVLVVAPAVMVVKEIPYNGWISTTF